MRIPLTGLQITRQKAAVGATDLTPTSWSTWFSPHEGGPGFWQRSIKVNKDTALTFPANFAALTLIAGDIAKLGQRLMILGSDGIKRETESPSYSPVLRRPNRYQNRIQFREHWILSKLTYGNTYALKVRDNRNVVVALYILDPAHVTPLVSPGAAVFYRLQADKLSPLSEAIVVPASEIIHDRMNPLFHPLIGVSPITACGLASQQGLEILRTSTKFFENGARPGGALTAPGTIGKETAERLKAQWQESFGGDNQGKIAVLGDGLKYEGFSINPVDAQLIDQLKMSAEMVATAYHVPAYKIGVGETPKYENAQVLNQIYYSDCLQKHIEDYEASMTEGLRLPDNMIVELNIDDLIRMDTQTQMRVVTEGVKGRIFTPDEGRRRFNLPAQPGGDSLYGQDQDHALDWIQWRDGKPGSSTNPPRLPGQSETNGRTAETEDADDEERGFNYDVLQAEVFKNMSEAVSHGG